MSSSLVMLPPVIGIDDIGAAVGRRLQYTQAAQPLFEPARVGLKRFLVEFVLRQNLLSFLVAKNDAVTAMQLCKKLVKLDALLDVCEQQGLQQRIRWSVTKFHRAAFRNESDFPAIIAVNVGNVLP